MSKDKSLSIKSNLVIGPSGRPKGVFLNLNNFRKLKELLEDVVDVKWMKVHNKEAKKAISWDAIKQDLKKEGTL